MSLAPKQPLLPHQAFHSEMAASWDAMGEGGPTLAALAAICAQALVHPPKRTEPFDPNALALESRAILFAARTRGIIEVRGVKTAFETPGRLLAIYVEESEHRTIAFRNREQPEITIKFFEAFCQLCRGGFILHHLHRDFTLSKVGYEVARLIDRETVEAQLALATEFGLHDS